MSHKNKAIGSYQKREEIERLYSHLRVYHSLHCAWTHWYLPCLIFAMGCCAVLGMYVGLRHTDLPWYLYYLFWTAGLGAFMHVFGVGHDIMFAKQDSEVLIQKLKSPKGGSLDSHGWSVRKLRGCQKPCRVSSFALPT